jgi:hypothetical protein
MLYTGIDFHERHSMACMKDAAGDGSQDRKYSGGVCRLFLSADG